MQGLESVEVSEDTSHLHDHAASMLVGNRSWHIDLIHRTVAWFDAAPRGEDQSFTSAVKSKYGNRAVPLLSLIHI